MSLYGLKWRLVIIAILLSLKEFIRMINYLMKKFEMKDLRKKKIMFYLVTWTFFKWDVSLLVTIP